MEAWKQLQPTIDRIVPLAFERGLETLSPAERNVLLVWASPAAVNNGGHASFFYNSYGEHAHETVQALSDIGAPEYAAILHRAIDLFPARDIPRGIDERNASLDALPEAAHQVMDALDAEFYELGDDELLDRLLTFWKMSSA
jgi:hypothetical protein